MLLKVAHRIASHPWVYDKIQKTVGVNKVYARLEPVLQRAGAGDLVLDIGGGTGTLKNHCAADTRYVCLDIEWDKLEGFRSKFPHGNGIWGDATSMPISSGSVDTAICMFVAHHLDDELLPKMLGEVQRTLRPGGRVILLDPIFDRKRTAGRILWKLDRGSFPRTPSILKEILSKRFDLEHWDQFAVWHGYILGVGRKRG
jgi:ubiquinone/menaquinone biosynthesis C-methylase UbiE